MTADEPRDESRAGGGTSTAADETNDGSEASRDGTNGNGAGIHGALRRAGERLETAVVGCIAVLPFAVALLPVLPGWVAIGLVLLGGALAVALVETDRLPVTYGAFFRWALSTGVLGYAGWQLAELEVPPTNAGVAFAYAVGGALVAVAVANYRRLWGVLVLDLVVHRSFGYSTCQR